MRSHGWSGNAPASDEEAIDRILDAADAIIAERGASMRIADVARALGVTRQTVYRYFPGTEPLLVATAMRSADGFLDRLTAHVSGLTDPVAAMVEGTAFTLENLGENEQIGYLLTTRRKGTRALSITSDTALAFGRAMFHRFDVDWAAHGFGDEAALNDLADFSLRMVHSLLVDPGTLCREPDGLRRYLARWLGPAIMYPRLAQLLESLAPPVTGIVKPRRARVAAS